MFYNVGIVTTFLDLKSLSVMKVFNIHALLRGAVVLPDGLAAFSLSHPHEKLFIELHISFPSFILLKTFFYNQL